MESSHLRSEDKEVIKNYIEAALHARSQGNKELATDIHGASCAIGQFLYGARGRILLRKSGEFLIRYGVQLVASGLLTAEAVAAAPLLVTAVGVGLVCYQVYSNFTSLTSNIFQAKAAWEKGDFENLGALTVDIGFDAYLMGNICKTAARSYKSYGAQKTFVEGLEKSNVIARKQEVVHKQSQFCLNTFKQSNEYKKYAERAIKTGTSPQAFDRRVENLSKSLNSPSEISAVLREFEHCQKHQGVVTPKGLKNQLPMILIIC